MSPSTPPPPWPRHPGSGPLGWVPDLEALAGLSELPWPSHPCASIAEQTKDENKSETETRQAEQVWLVRCDAGGWETRLLGSRLWEWETNASPPAAGAGRGAV
jgi:hypothetical protein